MGLTYGPRWVFPAINLSFSPCKRNATVSGEDKENHKIEIELGAGEMLQTLGGITPRFLNRSWLRNLTVRAMTFSSSSDYGDQSRGGLPRFYSEILPPSKAFILFLSVSFMTLSYYYNHVYSASPYQFHYL